jgi:Glycosyl hydrolases family 28/Carbohydrate binding module (family 35)
MRKGWRGFCLGALVLATAGALAGVPNLAANAAPGMFNVRDFGATGNGTTNDDDAIDRAINAAASAGGGGTVVFPSGRYRSRSIHLKSNITLQLNAGATVIAASSGIDPAEPNPFDDFQDFGHSHFHNALLWGENISNLSITGTGTFDGAALTTDNNVPSGQGDKILSLKRCTNLQIQDVTFRRGGHFAILVNGCDGVRLGNVKVFSSDDRDGINLINTRNVDIAGSRIEGSDDAVGLKSDFALGETMVSENIRVHDSTILSAENNALQFGSETCGDFRNIRFERLTITGAGKAGLGMVSQDGSIIEDVQYRDITLNRTSSPIYIKLGERRRCPGRPPAGRIRNISFTNITGTNLVTPRDVAGDDEYTSTITGTPTVPVENISFDNVNLNVPGGHPASEATRVPPEFLTSHAPRDYGKRPSYGFWIRHARGISFHNTTVQFVTNDNRPAFIADDGANIVLDGVRAERGSGSPYDVGVSRINGYAVRNSANTAGGALRVRPSNGSTPLPNEPPPPPPPPPPLSRFEAESATIVLGAAESTHAGFSGTGYVNTDNVVGSGVEWTVNAAQAGTATVTFGFTNGTTVVRPMDVTVNGALATDELSFPPTGAWTTYRTLSITVTLAAGPNTIRAIATTANGGPNLDYIDVA